MNRVLLTLRRNGFKAASVVFFYALLPLQTPLNASAVLANWIPDGPIRAMTEDSGTLFVGGSFRYFAPRVGSGVITNPFTGANLTAGLNIEGRISCAVADGTGGWVIGGNFTRVQGVKRWGLARLNSGGALDSAFAPRVVGGDVSALLFAGGILYVGGSFRSVNEIDRAGLATLDPAGQLLPWAPSVTAANGFPTVRALAEHNGLIHVGGDFSMVNGVTRVALAAVDTAGALAAWDPQLGAGDCFNPFVYALVPAGSNLYIGGCFVSVLGQPRRSLAAIGPSGSLLPWDAQLQSNSWINALQAGPSSLYVGGNFSSLGGAARYGLGAVDLGSGLATAFDAGFNYGINALALDGSVLYVGTSNRYFGTGYLRSYAAAFNTGSGALVAWDPLVTGSVQTLSLSGGRLFVGGAFAGGGGPVLWRSGLAALDTDGDPLAWAPNLTGTVLVEVKALAVAGGLVYAGGVHDGALGLYRPSLVAVDRFSALPAAGFDAGMSSYTVESLTVGAGSLFVGGSFSSAGGQPRANLAGLDLLSGAATAFQADANGQVRVVAMGPRLYAGGGFSSLSNAARPGLGAVDPLSGALDPFNPVSITVDNFGQTVTALLPYGNDLFVAGSFTAINSATRRSLARLGPTGAVLPFNAQITATWNGPEGLAVFQGSLITGGYLGSPQGQNRNVFGQFDPDSGNLGPWRFNNYSSTNGLHFAAHGGRLAVGGEYWPADGVMGQNFCLLNPPTGTPDAYEGADEPFTAAPLLVPAAPALNRGFHDASEATQGDLFRLDVVAGTTYEIETLGLVGGADPLLYLIDAPNFPDFSGLRWLAAIDDTGTSDLNARISWVADVTRTLFVVALPHYAPATGSGISYSIHVNTVVPGTPTVSPTISPTFTISLTPTQSPVLSPTPTATPVVCVPGAWGYTVSGNPVNPSGFVVYQGLSLTSATTAIGFSVDGAFPSAGLFRVALYADNGAGQPGLLLVQSADVAAAVGTVDVPIPAQALGPGLYFLALQVEQATLFEFVSPGPWDILIGVQDWVTALADNPAGLGTVPFTLSARLLICDPPLGSPTATSTETETETPSPTPTQTPSESPTETPSATPTATPTASPTLSPAFSETSTQTSMPSGTPTMTPSPTPTGTTTPLVASLEVVSVVLAPVPTALTNQLLTAVLTVSNTGAYAVTGIVLDPWTKTGSAGMPVPVSSTPASLDLLPGESGQFTYVAVAVAGVIGPPWSLRLRGSVSGVSSLDASTVQSPTQLSNSIQIYPGPPTATPTYSPQLSPTISRTRTPVLSPTHSLTRSPSPTRSPTVSATPTPSPSASVSPTVTPPAPFCGADVYSPSSSDGFFRVKALAGGGALFSGYTTVAGQSANVLLRRYAADGSVLWTQSANSPTNAFDIGVALDLDSAGRIYTAGPGYGNRGAVFALDPAGNLDWIREARSDFGPAYCDALAVAPDDRIAVSSVRSGEDQIQLRYFDAAGNSLAAATYACSSCFNFNLAFDACGLAWLPLTNGRLLAYDAAGTLQADQAIPAQGRDVAVDLSNHLAVAMATGSQTQVQRRGIDGTVEWTRNVAASQPWGVAVDREGSVYVCGDNSYGTGYTPGLRPFVAKYSVDGTLQWTWWGQAGRAESVAVSDDGTVWVAGWDDDGNAIATRLCQPALGPGLSPGGCPSPTPTITLTSSVTPSSSPTPSASPVSTATPTPTWSQTPSSTETPTVDLTQTWCAILSQTPTETVTASPSPTGTSTTTPSATPSLTHSPSPTASVTATPTVTSTPSFSASPTPTPSLTATLTQTPGGPTLTPTPRVVADGVIVLRVQGVPHPNPRRLHIELSGHAAAVRLVFYSPAHTRLLDTETGPLAAPWDSVAVPSEISALPNGLYYIQASARGGDGVWTRPKTAKLYLAR